MLIGVAMFYMNDIPVTESEKFSLCISKDQKSYFCDKFIISEEIVINYHYFKYCSYIVIFLLVELFLNVYFRFV